MKFFLAALLFSTMASFAQTYSISGSIAGTKESNLNATLLEFSTNKLIKVTIVKSDNTFRFNGIASGKYLVKISGIVINEALSETITLQSSDLILVPIVISMKENKLSEVNIVVKKPMVEVLPDKTVFNVQNSISSAGLTAFEVLRKAPGVVVDNNDNLIVEGKTGVQIYIDGKPSILVGTDLTNYLKTIQSSDVDSIEIITQPSSKYEAAGTAGILNIKLKKDKRLGTNGTLTTGYAIGRFAKYNTGLTLNNRSKKFNVFGTYSNRFDNNFNFINLNRKQSGTVFDSRTETVNQNNANNIKAGFDFYKSKAHTFGFIFNGNFNNAFADAHTRTPIIPAGNNSPSQVLVAKIISNGRTYNIQNNTNYRFADTLGHSVSVDVDFGKYQNRQSSFQPNTYFNGSETTVLQQVNYQMNTPINIQIISVKADYEQNLLKGKFGSGFKTSVVNTNNVFDFFDFNGNQPIQNFTRSNTFKFEENINAVYVNFGRTIKKFGFQFGLRAEQTVSTGDLISTQNNLNNKVKRNYTDYFPSAGLTFNPNENNALQLNYSRRIERPSYQSLNPFEMQLDELSFRRGNPFLQPQYTNNFKVAHTYKYTLSTSLSYSRISDFFAQITQADGPNRNFIMQRNVANQEVWNLGISYPFSPAKWWDVYVNLQASNSSFKGNDANFISITQSNFNFYGQNTFSLPSKIKLEVSGWFSSPSVWGGTYRTKSLGALDLALQKKVWKDKINIRMAVSDVFFTSPWRGDFQFGDLSINGNGGTESRQFRLNLSYVFGNSNVKASQRKTGTEDENNRI